MKFEKYIVIKFFVVVSLFMLLVFNIWYTKFFEHDDIISVIAATGNLGNYAKEELVGKISSAYQWQIYWNISEFGIFQKIALDLNNYDIHPPLYFWLLHIWIAITNNNLSSILYLNLILEIILILLILKLLRLVIKNDLIITITFIISIFGLINFNIALIVRQYLLFNIVNLLYLYINLKYLSKNIKSYYFLNFLITVLGLLTSYQFILVVLYSNTFVYLKLLKTIKIREFFLTFISLCAALIAFYLIIPNFANSFITQQKQAEEFTLTDIFYRSIKSLSILFGNFFPIELLKNSTIGLIWIIILAFVILLLLFLLVFNLVPKIKFGFIRDLLYANFVSYYSTFLFMTLFLNYSFFYIIHLLPEHAMGLRYAVLFSPFMFTSIGQMLEKLWSSERKSLVQVSVFIILISQILSIAYFTSKRIKENQNDIIPREVFDTNLVLFDTTKRGVLPRFVSALNPDILVLADTQNNLAYKLNLIPSSIKSFYYFTYKEFPSDSNLVLQKFRAYNFSLKKIKENALNSMDIYKVYRN